MVVPISYAIKGQQHAHNLAAYKGWGGSSTVQANLLALLVVFLADHGRCAVRAARATTPVGAAVVPSTRGRPGPHPLERLISDRIALPWIPLVPNGSVGGESRAFHRDWFSVADSPVELTGQTVLLLDDTWTTGSRVQSAACTLKEAGAAKVVAVVLGRHVNPEYAGWKPLLDTMRERPFQLDHCAVHGW
jgi:hypothetical protein